LVTILRRKLWREVWHSAGLLGAVGAIMAVGIMCYVSMRSSYHNLSEAKARYYRTCRMADFWIDMKKAPAVELEERLRIPGVAQWQSRIQFSSTVDLEDFPEPIHAKVISVPERRELMINDLVIRRGGYFTGRRSNEVIISDAFAQRHDLNPGDPIHVVMNNRRQPLWIVGTAISSEFTYLLDTGALIPDPTRFGVFYIPRRFAEEVFDFDGAANQVVGLLTPEGRGREDEVLRELERRMEEYGVAAAIPLELQMSNQFLANEIEGLGAFATVTPLMFLVTAALVLNVFLGRLARQQRTVVGTLKALGYEDRAIFVHFLSYGLIVGLVGGIVGSGLGYLASVGLTAVYKHYFEFPDLFSGFYLATHLTGLTVSLLCALLGSLRAARAMLRLRPAEAMRSEPPKAGGVVWLEQWEWLWTHLSAAWRMVLRNVIRGRWRTVTTAFSAMTGAALLVNGFMAVEAQSFLIDFQFEKVTRSDVDIVLVSEQDESAWDELARVPGVRHVEPTLDLACTMEKGPYRRLMVITGLLPGATLTVPREASGAAMAIPETGLVLDRRLADHLRVLPGEHITVRPVRGDRRPQRAHVARVCDSFIGMAAYADIRYLSRLADEPFVMTGAQVALPREQSELPSLYRQLKDTPGVQAVQIRHEMVRTLEETLLQNQYVMIVVLVGFAGVIFFGSILNASFVNLHERRREVASLLALGYSHWQVGRLFLRESIMANLVGTILGLPLGYVLLWMTARAYDSDFLRLPVVWAHWIAPVTLGLALLFTLLAHAVVQRSIRHLNIREELNVRE
jgi:putative ABC transport system permease protein